MADHAASLILLAEATEEMRHNAALVVAGMAHDMQDARILLIHLGIVEGELPEELRIEDDVEVVVLPPAPPPPPPPPPPELNDKQKILVTAAATSLSVRLLHAYKYLEMTDEEAGEVAGIKHGYWKRASDLRRTHCIEPTGEKRASSHSNVKGMVCRITDVGREVLRQREEVVGGQEIRVS